MQKLKAGQNTTMDITRPSGAVLLTILISLFTDGVSLVFTGHPILNRSFRNLAEGRAYLRYLKAEAAANTPLWLIVERAGAWTSAMAVADQAEQDLIDAVNATLDQAAADLTAQHEAEQARVADIVNGPRNGWNALRQAHTRTGKPTSQPMDRILDSAVDGYIPRGADATSVQLIALRKRGKVVLDWQTRNHKRQIVGAWIVGQQPEQVTA